MTPSKDDRIGFVPVDPSHYSLIRKWLEEPHVREWWGDPDEELGFIRNMVEGRDTTRPFIITLDGTPLGYTQYWFVGHHQNQEWVKDNPWLLDLPPEAIGVDVSIGDPAKLSKGIGTAVLTAFVQKLLAEGFGTIIIDPDHANLRAVRAYSKAGFRPIPQLEGRTGDYLLMQYDPNAHEMTI